MNQQYSPARLIVTIGLLLVCTTGQIAYSQAKKKLEIPFTLTVRNNIVVKAVLNRTDSLDLMLHTATSDLYLTEEAVRKTISLTFQEAGKLQSWGGQADARCSTGNHLQIGGLQWNNIRIWENKNSGVGTDGKFGLDLFKDKVIEINFDRQLITIYKQLPAKARTYQKLRLENSQGQLFVEASCLIADLAYQNRFLLHSGYSGGLLLDDSFVAKTGIAGKVTITEESSLKDSFGNTIKVKKAVLPALVLGNQRLQNVPAGFFSGAIGRQQMSVMGGDVLKRFNLIFDLKHNHLYLSPRQI